MNNESLIISSGFSAERPAGGLNHAASTSFDYDKTARRIAANIAKLPDFASRAE
jgi:hypothetical protein